MIDWFREKLNASRMRREAIEREKDARLEAAEQELRDLQERGEVAMGYLAARNKRNHWQESVTIMIQGAPQ